MRPDIREVVGHCVAEGHQGDAIAAMAFTNKLGSMAWRLKYGNDASVHAEVVDTIASRLKKVGRTAKDPAVMRRVAEVCVREALLEKCPYCGGRGLVIRQEVKESCAQCSSTGIGRASDSERASRIGVTADEYPKLESLFAAGHKVLADAMGKVRRALANQLRNN